VRLILHKGIGFREATMTERFPDGTSPFEDHDCGHLPCASWLCDDAMEPQAVAVGQHTEDEPELDPPRHVHDLWVVLGLEDG
jgi:hypothetical protein